MIQLTFKNLERSNACSTTVMNWLANLEEKFPDLKHHKIRVTLEMHNSPAQPGPDEFTVKIVINGPKYRRLLLERRSPDLYAAVAQLADGMLELLNRAGDRQRVRERTLARKTVNAELLTTK